MAEVVADAEARPAFFVADATGHQVSLAAAGPEGTRRSVSCRPLGTPRIPSGSRHRSPGRDRADGPQDVAETGTVSTTPGGANESLGSRLGAQARLAVGDQLTGQVGIQVLHGVLLSVRLAVLVRAQCDRSAGSEPVT